MNCSDYSPEISTARRFIAAVAATILVAWWGIHLNSLIQAVAVASETNLAAPGGPHPLKSTDHGATETAFLLYLVGVPIFAFATAVVLPTFTLVPRKSSFWRLPVLVVLSCIFPILFLISKAYASAGHTSGKWTDAGFNHVIFDIVCYLFLGISIGVVVRLLAKIYLLRPWAVLAWMGFGFAAIAIPCSLMGLYLRTSNEDTVFLVRLSGLTVPWPIIDIFLCLAGAIIAGGAWLLFRRNSIPTPPLT